MARKPRINYAQVEAGLNRLLTQEEYLGDEYLTPTGYILACKSATGIADWKIAKDLSVDSGVEVASQTVTLWRRKGEAR